MNLLFLNSAGSWGGNEKWVSMAMTALAPAHGVHLAYRGETVGRHITLPKMRLPFLAPVDPYTVWRLARIIRDLKISVLIPTKPADIIAAGIAGRLRGVPTLARLGIVRRLGPYRRFAYETMADAVVVNASVSARNGRRRRPSPIRTSLASDAPVSDWKCAKPRSNVSKPLRSIMLAAQVTVQGAASPGCRGLPRAASSAPRSRPLRMTWIRSGRA